MLNFKFKKAEMPLKAQKNSWPLKKIYFYSPNYKIKAEDETN